MTDVVSVKFKGRGKTYFFDPNGVDCHSGQQVVVETSKGLELAECVQGPHTVMDERIVPPLRPIVRVATADDLRVAELCKQREKEAFGICEEKIAAHGLDMKLVDVECNFEGNKILFFFTSDGRVDFRELVKDLASIFRARIELRQIGVRDEAKMLGGLGICGRPFCCATFMDEFQPVSIKMAKTQNLSLNPTKISGTCGRLMCCLKYEQEAYEYLIANSIKLDSYVKTPDGKGTVVDVNLFKGQVKVRLDSENDNSNIKTYKNSELFVMRSGKKGQMLPEPEDEPKSEPVIEEDDDELPTWLKPRPQSQSVKKEEPDQTSEHKEVKQPKAQQNHSKRRKKPDNNSKPKDAKEVREAPVKEPATKETTRKEPRESVRREEKGADKAPRHRKGHHPQQKPADKQPAKKPEARKSEKPAQGAAEQPAKPANSKNRNHRYHHNRRGHSRQGKPGEGNKSAE